MRSASKIGVLAVPAQVGSILTMAILALAAAALAGCGGSQDTPPAPLSTRFDDMYIAAVPLDQKQTVVKSQNDWSLAKMENAKAEADLNESTTQISIARNDQQAAQLGVDSAVASKKAAEASADTTRVNQAMADLHTAEGIKKAADERVRYLEVYRAYLQQVQRYAQENMYWREAQYELAKAELGQKNNIAPKGISFDSFPQQAQDREKRTASARSSVDEAKQRAMAARDTWRKAQDTADRNSGRVSNHVDPMASRSTSTR